MKKSFYILILNLLSLETFCQDRDPARLTISGGFSELGISPSEEIWVATRAGNTYYSKQLGDSWHIGPFGSFGPGLSNSGKTFERVNFFSEDTLMISGFIQEGGRQDFVFWSGDHGKSWQKVVFGKSSWIDAAFVNSNGKAWMSGSSQLIYYSQDRGKTWKSLDCEFRWFKIPNELSSAWKANRQNNKWTLLKSGCQRPNLCNFQDR